jgi:hypothetical protein
MTETCYQSNQIEFETTKKNSGKFEYTKRTWDFNNQLELEEYLEHCKYPFEYGATRVERNDEDHKPIEKRIGYKIKVEDKFKKSEQIVYLMTICLPCGEKIIKAGKSKNTLDKRSYSCGTEQQWTNAANCSETNYIYSQIFRKALKENIKIKFYIYPILSTKVSYMSPCGKMKDIEISPYEEVEKELNCNLKQFLGRPLIGEGNLHLSAFKD